VEKYGRTRQVTVDHTISNTYIIICHVFGHLRYDDFCGGGGGDDDDDHHHHNHARQSVVAL
jgi:hypothetical protein